eukprot:2182641-Pleurochrysis_carterae.AAC.1
MHECIHAEPAQPVEIASSLDLPVAFRARASCALHRRRRPYPIRRQHRDTGRTGVRNSFPNARPRFASKSHEMAKESKDASSVDKAAPRRIAV